MTTAENTDADASDVTAADILDRLAKLEYRMTRIKDRRNHPRIRKQKERFGGVSETEVALIVVLVLVAIIAAFNGLREKLSDTFNEVEANMTNEQRPR